MSEIDPKAWKSEKKRLSTVIMNIVLTILLIAAIIWGTLTYLNLDNDVYTNDAQVEEYINPINSKIPGYIKDVRFQEHQPVKKGDTLALIDDSEYRIQVEQAEAAYLSAMAARNVTSSTAVTAGSNLNVSDANISAIRARLMNAQKNYVRYANLLKEGAATQQQFDQVKSDYDALAAQTKALQEQYKTAGLSTREAEKRVLVGDAEVKRAHAALNMARLNLSYTVIRAPYNGVTGRRNIQEGQLIQSGQNLLTFVRGDHKWIVANYKETQLPKIKIGQKVKIRIDGLEQQEIAGTVTAISQATGSRYASVPVDNATGNFVKVLQRIPVKIEFSGFQKDQESIKRLRAGMNAEVRMDKK